MAAKKITAKSPGVKVELFCESEDTDPADQLDDEESLRWVRDQIRARNKWAWCSAHVRVIYKGILIADDYLGGCSYESEKDFKKGGYYEDMVATCLDDINKKLAVLKK